MVRGRLTGSYSDYDQAQLHIDAAFEIAPDRSGPFLGRAGLHYTMHRLDEAEADLARFEQRIRITDSEGARLALMRANIAAQRGDLDKAIAGAERALSLENTPSGQTALAMMLRSRGQWDAAEVMLDQAAADYHGSAKEPLAWIMLHKGIFDLERGRHQDALAHYQDAARILDGWWLVEEHIAEIMTLEGDLDGAQAMYQDIVGRTGKPEFMDALAGIARKHGATEAASAWHEMAHRIFEDQMRSHPEAAAGHALGHFLQDGPAEAERSLAMAQANAALRPNTEALALLARAEAAVSPLR
jgi:tetratricopeptide (TPR) repeat protein